MKILHIVDSLEVGGAEVLVSQMCQLQREQGHDVAVYAVGALGAIGKQLRGDGFTVVANVGKHLSDSTWNFYRLFRKACPDVVHTHNPTPTIYAAIAARLAGTSSVISTRHSLVSPPHNRVAEFKYSLAARFCDWIVGICDVTTVNLRNLRSIPHHKIVRIYNGIAPLRQPTSKELPAKSGFTLVFVGRLQPIKNLQLLLNAFQIAYASAPDLRLWIVGDGIERTSLEKLAADLQISDQVTFFGQQLDVAPYFSAADVFIMSSKSEGLPLSLLQAISLGVPVIVPDVGGMPEVVRLTDAGSVVPPEAPVAMAQSILRMVNSAVDGRQYPKSLNPVFNSQFSLQAMTDAYMRLYKDTARARKNRLG
jgi:glycosyltransferase involved in cell wall biosynthesis